MADSLYFLTFEDTFCHFWGRIPYVFELLRGMRKFMMLYINILTTFNFNLTRYVPGHKRYP